MKKYFTAFLVEWQQTITYRAESVTWFILDLLPLVYMVSLWQSLAISGRFTPQQSNELILYYFFTLLISRLTSAHFEDEVIDYIREGRISQTLLKPFSYMWFTFAHELTWRIYGLIYMLPVVIILLFWIKYLPPSSFGWVNSFFLVIILIVTFFQRFFVSWLISLSAFWFQESKSLSHFKWMLQGILGGEWLPLYMFPLLWQKIASASPFYYWYYFPVRLAFGQLSLKETLLGLLISLLWLGLLIKLSSVVWKKAIRLYSAFGN